MPATQIVHLSSTPPTLTTREHSQLVRAERTIAKGLKSFWEVGMALKDIRDQRLYRQRYGTFEEYCADRWDLSRPRAYQLCAASEVVADLSTNVDTQRLPESEAQARPLSRLKHPEQRQRAWDLAVVRAAKAGRAVTARDTEHAVRSLPMTASKKPVGSSPGGLRGLLDKIHTDDCIRLLPRIPDASVDALITDAPYGVGQGRWDQMTKGLAEDVVREALRIMKPTGSFFWFGNNEATAEIWSVFKPLHPRWLTWFYRNSSNIRHQTFGWNSQVIVYGHKGQPVFNMDEARVPYSENTSTSRVNHDDSTSQYGVRRNGKIQKRYHDGGRKPMDVLEFPAVTAGVTQAEGRWHPTQKPLALMRTLVALSTQPDDLVLDPFCGSGTTCLAARQLGRHYIGVERDPDFARKCRQRLAGE